VDENPQKASQYAIQSIPTLLLFKDGRLANRLVGALPEGEIERHLLSLLMVAMVEIPIIQTKLLPPNEFQAKCYW
jgi:thioredoxin-like negative regulator of GroEL